MTWQCGKSSGVAGAGQRWASSEVEFGLEVAVAVGSACSIAVIVVAGCSLLIELARQVRESLRVALRRSCPAVMIWRDLLFTPKEGHHKPVKIENPRFVLNTNEPSGNTVPHMHRKSYAMDELL